MIKVIVRKKLLKTASENSYPFKSYAYLNFGLEIFPQNRLEKQKIDSIQQCIILWCHVRFEIFQWIELFANAKNWSNLSMLFCETAKNDLA